MANIKPTIRRDFGFSEGDPVKIYTVTLGGLDDCIINCAGASVVYAVSDTADLYLAFWDLSNQVRLTMPAITAVKANAPAAAQPAYWFNPPPVVVVRNADGGTGGDANVLIYVVYPQTRSRGTR